MLPANPAVSVLMPAYNAERFIAAAIESILRQTFIHYEFIIVDDASTDSTWSIIKNFAARDPRIQARRNETNLGIAGNRNLLLSLACGKYIAWQDADDQSFSDRLELQHAFLEQHPEVGIVGGYLQFLHEGGRTGVRRYHPDDKRLRSAIFRYSPVAQPAAMIRKICFADFGLYDVRYPPAEDIDMSFRIGQGYQFANIQRPLIQYREHAASATFTRLKKIELTTLAIRWKFRSHRAYHPSWFDYLYNIAQFISIFVIPAKLKIRLFNYFRNAK